MPSLYNLVLFLHVSGDISLFAGIAAQLFGLAALRRAKDTGQARILAGLAHTGESLAVGGALLTIASGLYLAKTAWSLRTGWIATALGTLIVLFPPLIQGIVEPRLKAILRMVQEAPDGPIPAQLDRKIHDPLLAAGLQTVAALVLGIVFLMTVKPSLPGAILAMALSLALGLLSAWPRWRAAGTRRQAGPTNRR
jgi:hypothetical protein